MAFIQNTAFEARITDNSRDNLSHIAGLYQENGANADCSAGLLCVRSALAPNEGFDNPSGTRVYNENAWIMTAATAAANIDTPVYACDADDVQMVSGNRGGNAYAIGTETLGLGALAGRWCNFTRIYFDNYSVYRFGVGNESTPASTETYFTIANGLLVPSATAPAAAGSIYFELRDSGTFVEGNGLSYAYIDVVACRISVSAS